MTNPEADCDRHDFLNRLNGADIEINAWEYQFMLSNLVRFSFSPKQRVVVDKMIEQYAVVIGWKPDEIPF